MALDIASEFQLALQAPDFAEWLRQHVVKPAVLAALSESAADAWLTIEQAALYVYGTTGKGEALRKLIARNPDLARLASGEGRMRRFRRADLDRWISPSTAAQRRRERGEHDRQK